MTNTTTNLSELQATLAMAKATNAPKLMSTLDKVTIRPMVDIMDTYGLPMEEVSELATKGLDYAFDLYDFDFEFDLGYLLQGLYTETNYYDANTDMFLEYTEDTVDILKDTMAVMEAIKDTTWDNEVAKNTLERLQ